MSVQILIDNRELSLILELEKKEIIFTKSQLDIGDIQYLKDNNKLLVIERKTIPDLIASIKDGRYKEQKFRLTNLGNNCKIIYIIEGKIKGKEKDTKIVWGSILNMILRDNIQVFRTNTVEETALTVIKFQDKVDAYLSIDTKVIECVPILGNYTETIKSKKCKNVTPKFCFIAQLCQIPGISDKIALPIADSYGSMNNLIIKYNSLEDDSKRYSLLSSIIINEKRKVGCKTSKKIYEFLYGIVSE